MNSGKYRLSSNNKSLGLILGVISIIGAVILAIIYPNATGNIFTIFKLLSAIGAALIASIFFNNINVDGDISQLAITAGGGAAIFLLVYFYGPAAQTVGKMMAF